MAKVGKGGDSTNTIVLMRIVSVHKVIRMSSDSGNNSIFWETSNSLPQDVRDSTR